MGEFGVVRSKIPKELQTQLLLYCEKEGITPSRFVRDLVQDKVADMVPINKAGLNRISYDKKTDTFQWVVQYDDKAQKTVVEAATPGFLENLGSEISSALSLRFSYMKKSSQKSVPIPSKMKKLRTVK